MSKTKALPKTDFALSQSGVFDKASSTVPPRGGKRGRPTVPVDPAVVRRLLDEGLSWRQIAESLGVGVGTARRAVGLSMSTQAAMNVPKPCQNSGRSLL